MASKVGRMIQDQNLNVHSDGASVAGKRLKGDAFKTTKKGGRSERKPLGDVSNRENLQFTRESKKPAHTNFPEINSGASKEKGLSNTSDKVQINSSQKVLSDVSNTVKPSLQKTSSVVAEESCFDFENEGFLHDHNQCIKAMSEAAHMDQMEIFRIIHGPNPSKILSSPSKDYQLIKLEEESLSIYLAEVPENDSSLLHIKYDSPCSSPPLSPDPYTNLPRIWEDCDFQVIPSP